MCLSTGDCKAVAYNIGMAMKFSFLMVLAERARMSGCVSL